MKAIVPKEITDSVILSSNLTEDEYDAYDATVVYLKKTKVIYAHTIYESIVGDSISGLSPWNETTGYVATNRCYVEETHAIYQCNIDSTGQYPPNYISGDSPVWTQVGYVNKGVSLTDTNYWIPIRPTNFYACLDDGTSTQTSGVLTDGQYIIQYVLDASKCDAIALFNCAGETATFSLKTDSGTEVWSSTVGIFYKESNSWSEFFFEEPVRRPTIYQNMPLFYGTQLTVTITGTTQALCGELKIGRLKELGVSLWGAQWSIVDYSKKETNDYGVTYLSQGKYHDRLTLSVFIETKNVDAVKSFLTQYRATGLVFICDNSKSGETMMQIMIVYGFYKDLSIVLQGAVQSDCSIEIESLA